MFWLAGSYGFTIICGLQSCCLGLTTSAGLRYISAWHMFNWFANWIGYT